MYCIIWLLCVLCLSAEIYTLYSSNVVAVLCTFLPSSPILVNIQNTVKVGMNSETILTIRPDESEPVKLECERTNKNRNWYSDGIIVTPTNGQLTTADMTGVATLSISTLNANNTGNYTCKVTDGGTTEYIIVLGKYN